MNMQIGGIDGTARPVSPGVRHVVDHIGENFGDNPPLSGLAAVAGLSLSRFMVVVREQTDVPPHQFVCRVRVRAARHMLDEGQTRLSAAYEAGLFDQSHLTRHFKRGDGIAPGRYVAELSAGAGKGASDGLRWVAR